MLKILLFADWYEPGFKAGGPIRSCANFVQYMKDNYLVDVFTSDRDLGSDKPYDGIPVNQWIQGDHPSVRIYYCSPDSLNWKNIRTQMKASRPDFIYCNSMFSTKFSIFPLLISRFSDIDAQIVLSPRGMLRASALRYKPLKKKIFLKFFQWSGLYRHIFFHAADKTEMQDVQIHFGPKANVAMIPNFPAAPPSSISGIAKSAGEISMIFVGRIHPIKNLDFLLELLKGVRSNARLTIVGSIEDPVFWDKCQNIIKELPKNVTVTHAGEIPNHQLSAITAQHHIFTLPTQGENFGHAIFESLAIGRPVLISDQTPWRHLTNEKAGWDLPLDRPDLYLEAIESVAALQQEAYDEWSQSTWNFVRNFVNGLTLREDYIKLFSAPAQS